MSRNEERITSHVEVNGFVEAKNFIKTEDFDSECNGILGINLDESTNFSPLEILNKDVSIKGLDIDENNNVSSKIEEVVKVTDKEEYVTTISGRKEIEFFIKLENVYSIFLIKEGLVTQSKIEKLKKNELTNNLKKTELILDYSMMLEIMKKNRVLLNLFKTNFVWTVFTSLNEKILSKEPIQYIDSIKGRENIFRLGDKTKRLKTEIKEIIQGIHKCSFGKTILSL